MNKKNAFIVLVFLGLIVSIFFFTNKSQTPQTKRPDVIASFYPLYFFTNEIAGKNVTVKNLTPNGIEPHDYDPSPQDIANLQQSKLVVINDAGLEPWISKLQQDLVSNGVIIVNATEGLPIQKGTEENEEGETNLEQVKDPHVWLAPMLAKSEVQNILAGLIKIDPAHRTEYETNAKILEAKLDVLDQQYKSGLSTCSQRDFVTSHAAFTYLAKEYGLTMIPIAGLSPDKEPSPEELANVSDFAKERNLKYIFFESLVNPKLSETIAHEVGAQTLVLDPIEGISDDDQKQGKNYFTVMENNLKNLQIALQCKQ